MSIYMPQDQEKLLSVTQFRGLLGAHRLKRLVVSASTLACDTATASLPAATVASVAERKSFGFVRMGSK